MNSQNERQENIKKLKKNLNNLERIIQSQCNITENLCRQTGFAVDSHAMENAKKYAADASKLALNAQIRMEEYRRQHHEEMDKLQDEKEKLKNQLTNLEKRARKATNSASVSAELIKKIENPITLDTLNDRATLILKFATASGFLFLFFFICTIHWMPIGISLSETGGILMLGLGVGLFITLFGVAPSLLLAEPIFDSSEFKKWQRISFAIIVVLLFVGVSWALPEDWPLVIWYFLLLLMIGLIIFSLKDGQVSRKDKKIVFYLLYFLGFILSIIVIIFSYKDITTLLGFSKSETAIQLSESNFKLVQEQVYQQKIANIKFDKENRIVWPVRVLLRGIGTHSLISFNNNEGKELRMEVKTDESKLIDIPQEKGNTQNKVENCGNPNASAPAAASAATSLSNNCIDRNHIR